MLDKRLTDWDNRTDKILTEHRVLDLRVYAEKSIIGGNLSHNQSSMKCEIHQKLRDALADIERMCVFEFIGHPSRWDPADWELKSHPVYSDDIWREDFPFERVAILVRRLVGMFGEDYAVPLAKAVEDGFQDYLRNERMSVEVPIIMRERIPHSATKRAAAEPAPRGRRGARAARYPGRSGCVMPPLPELPEYSNGMRIEHSRYKSSSVSMKD